MLLIDNSIRKVPLAKINVDTPYINGKGEAQVLHEVNYDLVIGNVAGARPPGEPGPSWQETCAVTTRAQTKRDALPLKPLKAFQVANGSAVWKKELISMQENDPTLEKFRNMPRVNTNKESETSFNVKDGVLYRLYRCSKPGKEEILRQVMVPQPLREQVISIAHNSIMSGHLGVQKTTDKITSSFYWPGVHADVSMYCKSCDICRKTIPKGKVTRVPVEPMPLIDISFKRV